MGLFIWWDFKPFSCPEQDLNSNPRHGVQASDLTFSGDPHTVIPWVIKATLNILEVASKKPSIQRVVLVSSSSATYSMMPEPNGREIDISQ